MNPRPMVMSHTTCVSPVSGVPARLADPAKASVSVAGLSRRLPVPTGLVSKSVSRRVLWRRSSLGPGSGARTPVKKATPSYRFNVLRTGATCPMAATLAVLRHHT